MKVLITGATGFAGGHLARHLVAAGYDVAALARPGSATRPLLDRGVDVRIGELANAADVVRAVAGVEQVYHLAACYRTAGHSRQHYEAINVGGTQNVLAAARKHGCARVIHCSTVGVHGEIKRSPADENAPFAPGDVYQETKLAGEECARAAQRAGQAVVIFRPAAIYGPGDLRLLKLFRTVQRRQFRMFGAGRIHYHLIYIDDLVRGIELCGNSDAAIGETFILCGTASLSLNELVELVANAVGVPVPRGRIPLRWLLMAASLCETFCRPFGVEPPLHKRRAEFFVKHRSFSGAKAKAQLGFEPRTTARQGILSTAQWYRAHGYLSPQGRIDERVSSIARAATVEENPDSPDERKKQAEQMTDQPR